METYLQKLTNLQNEVGYTAGAINLIALLGLAGEAGEVLQEYFQTTNDGFPDISILTTIDKFTMAAKSVDALKKQIRDSGDNNPAVLPEGAVTFNEELFDKEMADQLYYLNALAINRGKTLEDYAKISFDKVSAKFQQNIAHGVQNKEMPPIEEK